MSQENVELVRRGYVALNSLGRIEDELPDPEQAAPDFWQRLASDVELHDRPELPDAKVYRGREAAKEFFRKTAEVFSEIRWEPRRFIDLGHAVVVETRIVATGRGSAIPTELDETDVFWFRGGKITRIRGFATTDEALRAVELPEQDADSEK